MNSGPPIVPIRQNFVSGGPYASQELYPTKSGGNYNSGPGQLQSARGQYHQVNPNNPQRTTHSTGYRPYLRGTYPQAEVPPHHRRFEQSQAAPRRGQAEQQGQGHQGQGHQGQGQQGQGHQHHHQHQHQHIGQQLVTRDAPPRETDRRYPSHHHQYGEERERDLTDRDRSYPTDKYAQERPTHDKSQYANRNYYKSENMAPSSRKNINGVCFVTCVIIFICRERERGGREEWESVAISSYHRLFCLLIGTGLEYLGYVLAVLSPLLYPEFTWYGGVMLGLFHITFGLLMTAFIRVRE